MVVVKAVVKAVAAAVARMEVTARPAAGRSGLVRVAWARRGRGGGGGGGWLLLSWIYYWSRPCARRNFSRSNFGAQCGHLFYTLHTAHLLSFYPDAMNTASPHRNRPASTRGFIVLAAHSHTAIRSLSLSLSHTIYCAWVECSTPLHSTVRIVNSRCIRHHLPRPRVDDGLEHSRRWRPPARLNLGSERLVVRVLRVNVQKLEPRELAAADREAH